MSLFQTTTLVTVNHSHPSFQSYPFMSLNKSSVLTHFSHKRQYLLLYKYNPLIYFKNNLFTQLLMKHLLPWRYNISFLQLKKTYYTYPFSCVLRLLSSSCPNGSHIIITNLKEFLKKPNRSDWYHLLMSHTWNSFARHKKLKTQIYLCLCCLQLVQVNELVQVETYLRSEGVLVRYWYPIEMLERPPAGSRRTAANGLVSLDSSNIQIHR